MLYIGWKKIYEGYDVVLVGRIKEALRESGVECKVRVDNPVQNRMSRDVAFGGNPLIINNIGHCGQVNRTGIRTAGHSANTARNHRAACRNSSVRAGVTTLPPQNADKSTFACVIHMISLSSSIQRLGLHTAVRAQPEQPNHNAPGTGRNRHDHQQPQ